jgi:hypothetical protein
MVTKNLAEELAQLLVDANVTPHTLAVLLGTRDATITHWLVYNRRPNAALVREARNTLKKIIEISQQPDCDEEILRNNPQQLRRILDEYQEEKPANG